MTSVPGEGTFVEVRFRACRRAPATRPADPGGPLPAGGTVLLVDDEPIVLEVAAAMLRELGWHTLTANSGKKGLQIFDAHRDAIDLVLLDQQMPGMSGAEVSRALWKRAPTCGSSSRAATARSSCGETWTQEGASRGFCRNPTP